MALSPGREDVAVALLDGPVARTHPDLDATRFRDVGARAPWASGADPTAVGCRHGTFVAGILAARRSAAAPGVCPGCTLLVRPIFSGDNASGAGVFPGLSAQELAAAIAESVAAGARIINLSGAVGRARIGEQRELRSALDEASRRGVIVVAAAGNQSTVGGTPITTHPAVISVVPYGRSGRVAAPATLGRSIGRFGICAPGEDVAGLDAAGGATTMSGSSVAVPFVAGAAALLWSLVPSASAPQVRSALVHGDGRPRRSIVPPLLDAAASYRALTN